MEVENEANWCVEHDTKLKVCLDEFGSLLHWCEKGLIRCRLAWDHQSDQVESVV